MSSRRVYVIDHGRVVFEGTPHALRGNNVLREAWLVVSRPTVKPENGNQMTSPADGH
jgi:ABC-type multidrug transport system ATPase subunit